MSKLTTSTALVARFEAIYDADRMVRTLHALAALGSDPEIRYRNAKALPAARAELNRLLDALTMSEAAQFGAWRKELLQAQH